MEEPRVARTVKDVETPPPQSLFGSTALDARTVAFASLAATVILPVTWLEERWRVQRLRPPRDQARTSLRSNA